MAGDERRDFPPRHLNEIQALAASAFSTQSGTESVSVSAASIHFRSIHFHSQTAQACSSLPLSLCLSYLLCVPR